MKKANIVPIVGISVLILCASLSAARDRRPVPTPTPAPAAQQVVIYRTEGEIVAGMEKKLEELYPGRWDLSRYASGEHTVVDVRIYSDSVAAARDVAVAGIGNMPETWDKLVESTRVASGNWAKTFTMNQIEGVMVQIGEYDLSDPETPCLICINGITTLDPVHGVDLLADVESWMEEAADAS